MGVLAFLAVQVAIFLFVGRLAARSDEASVVAMILWPVLALAGTVLVVWLAA